MKVRVFTVFVLVVSMVVPVLSKAEGFRIGTIELVSAPDCARVSAALRSAPLMFI